MPWNGSCCSCCCATFYGLLSQKWAATSKQEVFSCLHPFVKLFLLCVFYHSFLSKFVWCDQANWRNSFQPCMLFYVLHLVSHLVMRNAILYMISFIPLKKYYNTFIKKNCQPKKVKNAELSKCFQLYIYIFFGYIYFITTPCAICSLPLCLSWQLGQKQKELDQLQKQNNLLKEQLENALVREQSAREGYVLQVAALFIYPATLFFF